MFIVPVTRDPRQLSRLFDDTFERFFGHALLALASGLAAAGRRDAAATDCR